MELRSGFRRTEAGVVPVDWSVSMLSDLSETSSGTTPARAMYERYYRNGSIPWVKTMDLSNADLCATSESVTDVALKETSLRVYPVNTVLIAMYGGFVQIGRTGLLKIPATVNQAITAIQIRTDELVPEYLLATLNYRVDCWRSVASSSRKDPNITGGDIRRFPVAYPSSREQRAIAKALSDVDALRGGLDQLIAKKRDIRQAAAQQLLTGRTRLPGFSAEWEVKTLGDVIAKVVGGGTPSRANPDFWGDEIPWATVKDFATFNPSHTQEAITVDGLQNSASNLVPAGVLITSTRMALGKAVVYEVDVAINQDLKALFLTSDTSVQFLARWFEHFGRLIEDRGSGSTVKGISIADLKHFPFRAPLFPEQVAIAAVLSDMDAELTALEARRKKTRDLKQAVMQELLTGKTRLVRSEAANV